MKQFFKMFFASMLAMIVTGVVLFGVLIGLIISAAKSVSTEKESNVKANSVLVINLDKKMHEQGQSNSLAAFNDDDTYLPGLYDAVKAIEAAKKDSKIKGILLKLGSTPNGWATLQTMRNAIIDFKSSKKFVYAYGEEITQGAYYVASAADSVYLNPVGDIELKGFAMVLPFFKGTLDKLEVQPEIFYAGKFKSATEPFRLEKMSEPNRLQTTEFMTDFWSEFVAAVSQHTKADAATVNQWTSSGAIQFPKDALQYKLIDGMLYQDEVEQRIKSRLGLKEKEDIKFTSLNDYADHVRTNRKTNEQKIAVVFAEGPISSGESEDDYEIASKDMIALLRKIRKNDKVKAVVLRVNSPGGSALASEVILREIKLLREKKPVVVSMGDVAASGGYYIACQADSIFALPNTITGSIGVFAMLFNTEKLMKNKLGVTFDGVKNAPYADFPNGYRQMTEDEKKRMQGYVDNIYGIFKGHVARARKMDLAAVDSNAQGRVWSGTDALSIGLVDGLGDLDRAIASAAAISKMKDYQVVTYPEPVDKFESLIKKFKGKDASEAVVRAAIEKQMNGLELYKQIRNLKKMQGNAMMIMPYSIEMN
jgi:protease-4